jgi:hypothetical protein
VSAPDPGAPLFSAGDADRLGEMDDDDVIAVVRAGLREMEPVVGSRVDHHRFWRDGQKQRQRRNALVGSSAVLTVLAVLIPLLLVALPWHGGSSAQVRLEASPPVHASLVPTVLSGESLLETVEQLDPATSGFAVDTAAQFHDFLGREVVRIASIGGPIGTGAARISLSVNAYRLSSPPATATVTSFLASQLPQHGVHFSVTSAGTGSYWLQDTGWDGLAVAVTGSGLVVTFLGTPAPAERPAVKSLIAALAGSAM